MLFILLLLILLAGIFLMSTTTMFYKDSASNVKLIQFFYFCRYTLHLINSILAFLAEKVKFVLNIRFVPNVQTLSNWVALIIFSVLIRNINTLEINTRIEVYLLIMVSLILIYMICYDKYLSTRYPRVYLLVLLCCSAVFYYCFLDIILNLHLNMNIINSLIWKFNQLKGFWVKIKNFNTQPTDPKGNEGGPSNSNKPDPKGKSTSKLDPDEAKRRRKEAKARYREKNREKLNQANRESYAKDPEKAIKRTSAWKKDNPEKHKASSSKSFKKWVSNHRDVSQANSKKWRAENPDKVKINNDIANGKKKAITEQNRIDMAQYEGILLENKPMFLSWMNLNPEELKDLFKKKRIRKDLQKGFEFFKENPNYYDDLDMD